MKLKQTRFQMILEIITILILIAMIGNLVLSWGGIPDKVPGHYNAAGQVDRWGDKSELIFLPILTVVLYLLITVISFFPSIWNVPVTVTEENSARVYGAMKNMVCLMKLEIVICFSYLSYQGVKAEALSPYFLYVFLIAIFGTIAFYIFKAVKEGKAKTI